MPTKVGIHVFADSSYKIHAWRDSAITALSYRQVHHKDRRYFR